MRPSESKDTGPKKKKTTAEEASKREAGSSKPLESGKPFGQIRWRLSGGGVWESISVWGPVLRHRRRHHTHTVVAAFTLPPAADSLARGASRITAGQTNTGRGGGGKGREGEGLLWPCSPPPSPPPLPPSLSPPPHHRGLGMVPGL